MPFTRVVYVEKCEGAAALFVHGFSLNGYQWHGAPDRPHPHRRCIAPDLMTMGLDGDSTGREISPATQATRIGIGLRVPHYRHILTEKPVVDWFEIISENFMGDNGHPLEVLVQILEQYRVVQHGVAIYFGSDDDLDKAHLKKLKRLVRRTNTPWLSGHLCWGSIDGRYNLLPMPYTFAVAKHTAEKIEVARDFIEVPICVENVSSYAEYHASEMTEWEFISEVAELGDYGILLDVNNIYVSSKNHTFLVAVKSNENDALRGEASNAIHSAPRGSNRRKPVRHTKKQQIFLAPFPFVCQAFIMHISASLSLAELVGSSPCFKC